MIDCRASGRIGDCPGYAQSAFYPKKPWPDHIPQTAAWEFYRPTDELQIRRMGRAEREHVQLGGLLLRKRVIAPAGAPA